LGIFGFCRSGADTKRSAGKFRKIHTHLKCRNSKVWRNVYM
jgi:hypothetical protein